MKKADYIFYSILGAVVIGGSILIYYFSKNNTSAWDNIKSISGIKMGKSPSGQVSYLLKSGNKKYQFYDNGRVFLFDSNDKELNRGTYTKDAIKWDNGDMISIKNIN